MLLSWHWSVWGCCLCVWVCFRDACVTLSYIPQRAVGGCIIGACVTLCYTCWFLSEVCGLQRVVRGWTWGVCVTLCHTVLLCFRGVWSTEGCERVVEESNSTFSVCECQHLTHFAILLSPGVTVRVALWKQTCLVKWKPVLQLEWLCVVTGHFVKRSHNN